MIPPTGNISGFVTENISNMDFPDAQGMIDAEIEKLRQRIRVLKRYRNDLSPINRLPREILLLIFQQLIPDLDFDGPLDDDGRHPGFPSNLLNVTYVSQGWRSMALESSGLWSRIVSPPFRFAKEMLARSRDTCLEVDVRGDDAKRFLPCVFGQLSRIRVLAIDRNEREPAFEELDWPAPLLETLSLHRVVLPRRLFAGQCQKLKQVYLRQCVFRWSYDVSTPFRNLITLQLKGCDGRLPNGLPSVLFVLEAMPLLRKLQLDHSCLGMPDDLGIAKFGPPVVMPSLVDLEFVDSAKECVQFLEHFIFPKIQSARFGIHDSYYPTESIRPSDFCDAIRRSFQHRQDEQPYVFIDFDFGRKLRAYTAVPPEAANGSSGDIEPRLQLKIEYWPTFLPDLPRIFHTQYVWAYHSVTRTIQAKKYLGSSLHRFVTCRNVQLPR
ncbi:hypothetical protein JAAARDRAFT_244328 [Jaapia argillacea MUCL 33604]|uniref:F-box domain-containing protein n=1 Tax=Jaapia argillacea MUCL 33604 TaxID=933084 RepID=A0A067QFP2_9AGAM|nr:hypothetical protein JAAARDRAFT_244328 [Jaapia argillacea MUCL 33604]